MGRQYKEGWTKETVCIMSGLIRMPQREKIVTNNKATEYMES